MSLIFQQPILPQTLTGDGIQIHLVLVSLTLLFLIRPHCDLFATTITSLLPKILTNKTFKIAHTNLILQDPLPHKTQTNTNPILYQ